MPPARRMVLINRNEKTKKKCTESWLLFKNKILKILFSNRYRQAHTILLHIRYISIPEKQNRDNIDADINSKDRCFDIGLCCKLVKCGENNVMKSCRYNLSSHFIS